MKTSIDKLKQGLSLMRPGFAAELCWRCDGVGEYDQLYNMGCGMGMSNWKGDCEYCKGVGLLQGDKPAPPSVINQVITAAENNAPPKS